MQAMLSKQDTGTAMGRLFKRIAELTGAGFDTIIHVGAGADADLYDYQQLGFERLVLVEGDAESAEGLRAAVHDRDGVEVVEQVIAPETEGALWHRYNLPALNSVLPPGELHTLYPRLRVMSREQVQAISLQELLERAALNLAGRNLLFLDVPGTEDALLAGVPEGLLHAFEWIAVHGNQGAYYEGSAEIDASLARLKQHGFRLEALDSGIDFEWPVALLQRDNALFESRKLRAQIADLGAELEARATAEQELNAELERVATERDAQAALAAERENRAHGLEHERQGLAAELAESQVALKARAEEKCAHEKRVAEQQAQIDALSKARDEQAKLAADRHSVIQQLTQGRDEQAKLAADQKTQLEKLREERDLQAKKLAAQAEENAALAAQHQAQTASLRQERDAARKQLESEREQQAAVVAKHEQRAEALKQETDERVRVLTQERDEQAKLAADQKTQLEKLREERDQQARELTAQAEENAALAAERLGRIEALTKRLDTEREESSARVAALEDELSDARRTASLAVKLQTLREQDLKDLQGRYESAVTIQRSQHQVLVKLGERLNVAARYFHELANQGAPAAEADTIRQQMPANHRAGTKTHVRTARKPYGKRAARK